VDLRQLRYFIAISEARSLSQAARNVYVTQPTLTASLKKLEADLHTRLVVRTPGSELELTAAGRRLYDEGCRIVRQVDALVDEIRGMEDAAATHIRVGLTVLFAMQHMPSISEFIATHVGTEVTLVQSGSMELQKALVEDEIDVALVSYPVMERDISIEPLPDPAGSYSVSVVMKDDNPLAGREAVTFADLAEQRFCSLSDRFVLGRVLRRRSAEVGFTPDVVLSDDNWEVLIAAVRSLDAVVLMPASFERRTVLDGLVWVPLDDKANHFPIGIATHRTAERSGVVDEFIETIRRRSRAAALW